MKADSRILISGAGIAGLGCALWLSRAGFRPVVVEQADTIRAGGFLVSLAHHAYRFAEQLGLMPELRAHSCGIQSSGYYDAGGRNLLELQSAKLFDGVAVVQLMRDDLARILFNAAQSQNQVEFRFSDSIETVQQTAERVEVGFASGKTETFAAVIGADGGHSAVRQLVFPASAIKTHYLDLSCAAFRLPNVLGLENRFETHMQRDRYMAIFTTGAGDLGAVFVWANPERRIPATAERYRILTEAFSQGDEATRLAIGQCPRERSIYMDSLMQIDAASWSQGRVALIGDAAHCLTLFSGRGAAAAFNGASRLAQALIAEDVGAAFQTYERQMRPLIRSIQPATRRAVKWYVPRSLTNQFLRNNAMRLLPNALFRQYFKLKYSNI